MKKKSVGGIHADNRKISYKLVGRNLVLAALVSLLVMPLWACGNEPMYDEYGFELTKEERAAIKAAEEEAKAAEEAEIAAKEAEEAAKIAAEEEAKKAAEEAAKVDLLADFDFYGDIIDLNSVYRYGEVRFHQPEPEPKPEKDGSGSGKGGKDGKGGKSGGGGGGVSGTPTAKADWPSNDFVSSVPVPFYNKVISTREDSEGFTMGLEWNTTQAKDYADRLKNAGFTSGINEKYIEQFDIYTFKATNESTGITVFISATSEIDGGINIQK